MKTFLKTTLASMLGFLLAGILFLIILVVGIASSANFGEKDKPAVREKSVLKIEFNYSIPDKASNNPFDGFNFMSMSSSKQLGLNSILKSIEKAKTDDKIKGIYLDLAGISANFGSMATLEEIRNKLIEFKKTKKFIYAYSNFGYSQKTYYLASISDKIYLNPEGSLMWSGMGGEMVFYTNALKKLGISPQIVRHGKYKAAVEPFMLTKMSKANKEQTMKYVGGLWNHMLKGISKYRKLSVDRLNELADNFDLRDGVDLVKTKMIDGALYEDQMLEKLRKLTDIKEDKKIRFISLMDYSKTLSKVETTVKDKIAVVYATGEIGMKQSSKSIGPDLANTIRKIRKDDDIKAVVLRVNSPGGSALTSEIIWREVCLLKAKKPLIVSMGNVAASGGYYISCAADAIVASPTTITGSIGIFGLFFSGEKLIKEKIGLTTDSFGTNKHSNFGGGQPLPLPLTSRELNSYEKQVMQKMIEKGYHGFISKVAKGRKMSLKSIDAIGQGRVWTGVDAKKIGLVDVLGGLETAIDLAKKKAKLEDYKLENYPKEEDTIQELIKSFTTEMRAKYLAKELGVSYLYYQQIKDILRSEGLQARIPYNLELH